MIPGTIDIPFPKQLTVAYIDSLLAAVRKVRGIENSIVHFDLKRTTEVSALSVCFLCGLTDLAWGRNNKIRITLPSARRAQNALRAIRYLSKPDGPQSIMVTEKMCQLRRLDSYNTMSLDDMLAIIAANAPRFTPDLKDMARLILTELLTNTLDHSGERTCYACVGSWGRSHNMHIAFLDFGVGIPYKLRTRYEDLGTDKDAIQRLLKESLTTRDEIEGGRGYQIIQEALRHNSGRLYIFSGKAKIALKYDRSEYDYKKAQKSFMGTCVDFQINLDGESYYDILREEEGIFNDN